MNKCYSCNYLNYKEGQEYYLLLKEINKSNLHTRSIIHKYTAKLNNKTYTTYNSPWCPSAFGFYAYIA